MEKVPYLGQSLVKWQCGPSTFLALPERGARLMNWNILLGDGSVRDVIYWPEIKSIDEFAKVRGGNPILFPFCARTFDRGLVHHWRSPDGERRAMPAHGLARQSEFAVTRLDARGFAAVMVPGEEARACYPFDYEFEVAYRFESFGLACEYTLRNLGTQPIPWCAGHHFYFICPWSEGATRADYIIRIPSTKTFVQDMEKTGGLLPGPALRLDEPLNNPDLVNVFHTGLKTNSVVFGEKGRPGDVHVRIGNAKVPPPDTTVVTWTPDDKVPYFCVEPWMGPANAPEHQMGLHWVQPGQSQNFIVEVAVK